MTSAGAMPASKLGLDNDSWKKFLKPHVLGILDSSYDQNVEKFESKYEMHLLDKKGMVRVITRLLPIDDEMCFMIDSDFYNVNKTSLEESERKLDYFNKRASRLFRWCITESLHQAMEPKGL